MRCRISRPYAKLDWNRLDTMTLQKPAIALLSFATMICAFIASYYWLQSSRPTPMEVSEPNSSTSDDLEGHVLTVKVEIYGIRDALMQASLLNAKAAKWSAWAAGLGGLAALISLLP